MADMYSLQKYAIYVQYSSASSSTTTQYYWVVVLLPPSITGW